MTRIKTRWVSAAALTALSAATPALAHITVGISWPLAGPAWGLGIPMPNYFKRWPASIAGKKLNLNILDDATDTATGVENARKFVIEDQVDLIIGSAATPVAIPIADAAMASGAVQLAASPIGLPPGKDAWSFRLPQRNDVMAHAVVELMKKQGIKTIGWLGYTDAYGEQWLKSITAEGENNGIKVVATERFARSDTGVTAQAPERVAANPDAMLVASGSGDAVPEKTIVEHGYQGKTYQIHAAASNDLMRIGGKEVEGTFGVSGPAVVGDLLPDSHPSKKRAMNFVAKYEKAYGPGSRQQFAGHAYGALIVLEKVVPAALKEAEPGTQEFRAALNDTIEAIGRTVFSHGGMNWTAPDHWGYTPETGVMLVVRNGDWALAN